MNRRIALPLAACAGSACVVQAQEYIQVTYSWQEVQGLTTVPVIAFNSVMDPGEGARISINIRAFINGSSAIGQTTTYPLPPPPGVGTVRGIASMIYNLRGDFGAGSAMGTWGPRSINSTLGAGAFTGNSQLNGALLDSFGGGQFVAPGGTANGTNPIINAFRGVWLPSSYGHDDVIFRVEPGTAAPLGQQNGLLLAYSVEHPDPNDPTTWYDNLVTKYIPTDYGPGLRIVFIPAPSTALIATLAIVSWPRRRRGTAR